jgi:hypothetical protein
MEPNPPTLNYGTSGPTAPPRSRGASWGMFFLGIVAGLVLSCCYYLALGNGLIPGASLGFGLGAVVIKVAGGVALIASAPRWKSFGIGLIVSIPVAILVFVGLCFGVIAFGLSGH